MKITETTQYTATAMDSNGAAFASFYGSIDTDGIPTTSYNVSNQEIYKANVNMFREQLKSFEDVVFAASDARTAAVADARTAAASK
ncbi:hypothetical protein EFL81_09890 [Weissella confusa]|uniref:hypothetical protein n=1 Tax=Weissella confusa TaxID=1583 RepID=UPI00223B4E52|nr:hypothetical protein [Weissella confusa]MCS9997121.1 hypothetical protein [Weissella confusa]